MKKLGKILTKLLALMLLCIACEFETLNSNELAKHVQEVRNDCFGEEYSIADSFQFPLSAYRISGYVFNEKVVWKGVYKGQHAGEDAHGVPGTSIYAVANGCIKLAKDIGWGHGVTIEHQLPNGEFKTTLYGHLRATNLKGKGKVTKGTKIGEVGSESENGHYPPHLHWQVREGTFDGYTKGWVPTGEIRKFYHPTNFINSHRQIIIPLPQKATDEIMKRLSRLSYSHRGSQNIHWYAGHEGKVVIQDIKLSNGCDAAVVFDVAGQARKAYLIQCGFWGYFAKNGGPGSKLGMPITEEYANNVDTFQDFKNAYLSYRHSDGAIDIRYYPRASPGKAEGAVWLGNTSYAIVGAYERHRGRLGVGDATPKNSPVEVHPWAGIQVQDFDFGGYGWCILMFNPRLNQAYVVRSGFWQKYRDLNLIKVLGAPREDEYNIALNYPIQHFEGGYMEFNRGKFKACLNNDQPACAQCGDCRPYFGSKGGLHPPDWKNNSSLCTPGQKICQGTIEKTCQPDGQSWSPLNCPCSCQGGSCQNAICFPNQKLCQNNEEKTCSANGCSWLPPVTCPHGCGEWICRSCVPSSTRCQDQHLEVCRPDGSAWDFREVCDTGCQNGVCLPVVNSACQVNSFHCIGKDLQICRADGGARLPLKTCQNLCQNGKCHTEPYPCEIIFDPRSGKLSLTGKHPVIFFSSSRRQAPLDWRDHRLAGLNPAIPPGHERVFPRGQNDSFPSVRECRLRGSITFREAINGLYLFLSWKNSASCSPPASAVSCSSQTQICADAKTARFCLNNCGEVEDEICVFGCVNGSCLLSQPKICAPNQRLCKDSQTEQTCSVDGLSWTEKNCSSGCQNNACLILPQNQNCPPNTERCVFGNELQLCPTDGSTWLHQYFCTTVCAGAVSCLNQQYPCQITFNERTREVEITGKHTVLYFSSMCKPGGAECHQKDHQASGLKAVIPKAHNRVMPRGPLNSYEWQSRVCKTNGQIIWQEWRGPDDNGGTFVVPTSN